MIRNNQTNKKGFTLIELLVVMAIIAVLATILLSGVVGGWKSAKLSQCQSNLRKLYYAMVTYNSEYKVYPRGDNYRGVKFWEVLRTLPTSETAILQSKDRDSLYVCPVKGEAGGSGICHYRGPNYDVSDALKESDPVGADMAQNHAPRKGQDPINVLYWGGTVMSVKYDTPEWKEADDSLEE